MLRNEKGFTLIEIIAVLVILGILAAVAVPKYISMMDQSRISAAQSAIAEVKARCSNYYADQMLAGGGTIASGVTGVLNSVTTTPYIGPDYTVAAAAAGSGILISVSVVKGATLPAAVTGTWYYPGM